MAERVVRNVEKDYLICSICLGRYKEPRLLPCGHTFCRQCLEDHIRKTVSNRNSRFFTCPFDRTHVPCPSQNMDPTEWASLFPADTFLSGIIQAVNLHESSSEEKREMAICFNHNDRLLEFYCLACNVMACSYCVVKSHKKQSCDCITIDEATEKLKPRIESVNQKLIHLKESARQMLRGEVPDEGFAKSKDRAYYLLNSLEGKVNRFFESAVRSISEMRHQVQEARAGQVTEKQQISLILRNINTAIETFDNICLQGTGAEIINVLPKMVSQTDEYNTAVEMARRGSLSYQLNFIPNNALEDFLSNVTSFGSVRVTGRGLNDLNETSPIDTRLEQRSTRDTSQNQQRTKLTLSVKNATECTSTWQLTGIAFVGEYLIIVDNYNNKLRQCNYTKSLSVRHQIAIDLPVNVTSLVSSTDVAVTQPNRNLVTFVSTDHGLEVKKCIATKKQYEGICYHSNRTILVSCCITGFQCVDVMDYSGRILRTIQKDSTGEDIFSLPKFITPTTSGKILVSDRDKRQLICLTLDTEARIHWGYGTPAAPWGVACDANGKVYLCLEDNVVQMLTEEGTLVDNRFITAKDGIKFPYAVCAGVDHVAVTEWGTNVFAHNSQWVHIFT